jgi:hypothetical protein
LSDREAGRLSLAEFEELLDRHVEQRKHDKLCAGAIAAAVYNIYRERGAEALTAGDIFPELRPPEPSEEEILEAFKAFLEGIATAPAPQTVMKKS